MRESNGLPKNGWISSRNRTVYLDPTVHLIALRIAPCFDDREMVGRTYLLQNDIRDQACISFGSAVSARNSLHEFSAACGIYSSGLIATWLTMVIGSPLVGASRAAIWLESFQLV
jgi:hypothetical protein